MLHVCSVQIAILGVKMAPFYKFWQGIPRHPSLYGDEGSGSDVRNRTVRRMRMARRCLPATLMTAVVANVGAQWQCGEPFMDPCEGHIYRIVRIGDKWWIAENLDFGSMIRSTSSGYRMSNGHGVENYCWNDDTRYCSGSDGKTRYGALYE